MLAQSLDHGRSWEVLAQLPDDLSPETVEVAAADADRIYVSGTAAADPLEGIVERSDDGGLNWARTSARLPKGSGSLFLSGIDPRDPDRLWFRVPGRGDIYGVLPARLWRSTDAGATFDQMGDTRGGMLGFALSPGGDRVAFGGPLDGLFVAPSDGSAAPSKVAEMQVSCLRWHSSGLYACALEPANAYSLGYAAEPTQGFIPLWRRANTCRDACTPESSLEMKCRDPWQTIAPLVGADTAVCDASSSMHDAGTDAGPDAAGTGLDAAMVVAPSPTTPATPSTASGCGVAFRRGVRTPSWLEAVLLLAGSWMIRVTRPTRSCKTDPRVRASAAPVRSASIRETHRAG